MTVTKKIGRRFNVEIDQDRLERIASALGWFKPEFLKDLEAAEADVKAGRMREIKSFRELDE